MGEVVELDELVTGGMGDEVVEDVDGFVKQEAGGSG